jgi:hypothetical protein
MFRKTIIAFTAVIALGCVPVATNAIAAPHGHGRVAGYGGGRGIGHRGGYYGGGYGGGGYVVGPIYDSCAGYGPGYGYGYGYNGCSGYGAPLVGGVINGILGGYGPY